MKKSQQKSMCLVCAIFVLLCGCAKNQPLIPLETAPDAVAATPELVALDIIETPVPTPIPTDTPAPTPTVNPTRVTYREGFYYEAPDDAIKARITGVSYPENGGKITYDELSYIVVQYADFDGVSHSGELIAAAAVAQDLVEIFAELYDNAYPIHSILLVDEFGADDDLSMEANNTSCFNYRVVGTTTKLSQHSYGRAIDINPLFNPYITKDGFWPKNGRDYEDRTRDFPGKIDHDDLCYRLFIAHGWAWGGDWKTAKDYQHFSKVAE